MSYNKKLYFKSKDDDDLCYELETHKKFMVENGLKELVLFEAERELGTGFFFCNNFLEVGEVGESCGKFCESYKPNNGKNGRCRYYRYVYTPTDKTKIIKL